jgi:acyl-coenzyme A synthetase/AMP-(fatty) acid ligase
MELRVLNDNGTISTHNITKEAFIDPTLTNKVGYIAYSSKEQNFLSILKSFYSDSKAILYDNTNKAITHIFQELNITSLEMSTDKTIFDDTDFNFLLFTSGSTGIPVGAFKTKQNLLEEIEGFVKLVERYNIKKVVVTVPFIHIYGILIGLLYPVLNNIDIELKEHFLPHDLLELIDDNTLVVTTPLYIKSLNKLNEQKDLSKSIFVSSTAPLDKDSITKFNDKFNTNIIQLFGSTETGGIAYKIDTQELWTPLDKVEVSTNETNELKIKSPYVSNTLYENGFKTTNQTIQTFDYIEKDGEKFKLVGRSSKILKVAGKRYSTVQIEDILESQKEIKHALVFVDGKDDSLRGEKLDITIESKKEFTTKEIKSIIKKELSNLKFSINLKIVDKIPTSATGKKLKID